MAPRKPIALWAVPRSLSTAFERIFVEREDFRVFHEPFSAAYYYGQERRSDRFASEEAEKEHRYGDVLKEILAPGERQVFIKDMAYHVAGFMDRGFVESFTNTFIIREPSQVISSLHRMWPDFTLEETGYEQLHRLFGYATGSDREPVVVDAHTFSENTEAVVAAYCEKLGIPFAPDALSWERREVPEWEMWDEWHANVQQSTSVEKVPREEAPLPPHLWEAYEHCLPYYEDLYERRLRL